jgi:hypothetical protein
LAPSDADELLLCRYHGYEMPDTPESQARVGKLAAQRLLNSRAVVSSIRMEFDRLPELSGHGATTCFNDTGARLYAIFDYAAEPPVPIEVNLSGCRFAGNGRSHVAAMSPRLQNRLERLTRPFPQRD